MFLTHNPMSNIRFEGPHVWLERSHVRLEGPHVRLEGLNIRSVCVPFLYCMDEFGIYKEDVR